MSKKEVGSRFFQNLTDFEQVEFMLRIQKLFGPEGGGDPCAFIASLLCCLEDQEPGISDRLLTTVEQKAKLHTLKEEKAQ